MTNNQGNLRVGTSGWQYSHWRGGFYPDDLPKKEWFDYYARQFDTVEINNTFYRLPEAATFRDWKNAAPHDFLYVLKYSRYGSHLKHLKDPEQHVETFLSAAEALGEKLGAILVQLPGNFKARPERLEAFLRAAPSRHRWAFELRNESWYCEEVYNILREHNASLALHTMPPAPPWVVTADWVYLRYHGPDGMMDHPMSPSVLSEHARQITQWLGEGADVYAYFNNDLGAHAPADAQLLRDDVLEQVG
ncbi:MAG: DUF72 domain-containing protein [Planctomycetota bacterium]